MIINVSNKGFDSIKHDNVANENRKGVISAGNKKEKPALLTRTCPPGLALAGPDMSEVRVSIKFYTLWVQNCLFDVIS